MKLLRYDNGRTALLVDVAGTPQVLDVAANLGALRATDTADAALLGSLLGGDGAGSWLPMIDNWALAGKALHALLALAQREPKRMALHALDSVKLVAPLAHPHPRIFALGGNVASHMAAAMRQITGNKNITAESIQAEKDQGLPPWGFLVLPETVVGQDARVSPPPGTKKYDYESEVAVILGAGGSRLKPEQVQVWGYTAWNDLSIRDGRLGVGSPIHRGAFSWAMEKNFDTGNVCGPWVVVDEPRDPMKLRVQMRVNGVTRQDWNTQELMYSFAETASFLSHYASLRSGDMIASGTGHGTAAEYGKDGDRWLNAGDKLEVEVEGVGVLRNDVARW